MLSDHGFPVCGFCLKGLLKRLFSPRLFLIFSFFFPFNCLVITKVYSGIQTYRRSVSLSPLTIFFLLTALFITKVYSGIQTYRRSVSLSPLTIFFFLLTALFITKVYSGIQTYRRSVSLSPLTIFSSAFNCSVIRTKV